MSRVIVIGAGVGGLAAACRLARAGHEVRVLEARDSAGGLASDFELAGLRFDAGPYILLDRPGLEWAFARVGLELERELALRRVEEVYEVLDADGTRVSFHADSERTAEGMERSWPGSARRYLAFVERLARLHERVRALQLVSRPRLGQLLRSGGWRDLPFLLRSLASVLRASGLPAPVVRAIAIWTQIAGQRASEAPSPMAMIPGLIHDVGAFVPEGGIGAVARRLLRRAHESGVAIDYGTAVERLWCEGGRARGVVAGDGARLDADAVLSNASGVGTYLELCEGLPRSAAKRLRALPLQSPGVCAYIRTKQVPRAPYLRFQLPGDGAACRLLVQPGVVHPDTRRGDWYPLRLISPLDHERAQRMSSEEQHAHLSRLLDESWWRGDRGEHEVLATRVPAEWGARFHLHRDAMNPVMTARFMRAGRLAHRSPYVRGLYLAGSATHPGQWVSFCAVSGVLAADLLHGDLT